MYLLGVIGVGLVVLAIILIILRVIFDLRFTAIQKEPDQTLLFRRKVNHLGRVEQAKHIRHLLLTCLTLGTVLVLSLCFSLFLADGYQKMRLEHRKSIQRIEDLEEQQEHLTASIPLKNYPKEGIGLEEYDWGKLVDEEKDSDWQKQMESNLAKKMMPYSGATETEVSLDEPRLLSLQFKGQAEDSVSMETIKRNLDDFSKEAEEIKELTNIHVRMIASVGKENKIVYSVNYSREKSGDPFTKKNISEQNLKNDGEKG